MKPDEGRLQTAQHILARILQDSLNVRIGGCTYSGEHGVMEVFSAKDLKGIDLKRLEQDTNNVISRDLEVKKQILPREQAEKIVDLGKVPGSVQQIRIVEIGDFDKRSCKDLHVDNTNQIGKLKITKLKYLGEDRYRFIFTVD